MSYGEPVDRYQEGFVNGMKANESSQKLLKTTPSFELDAYDLTAVQLTHILKWHNLILKKAQADLLTRVEGIVGEDDSYNEMCECCNNWDEGRNELRTQIRAELKELKEEL